MDSAAVEEADYLAIVDPAQEHLAEEGITTVRVGGDAFEAAPQLGGCRCSFFA